MKVLRSILAPSAREAQTPASLPVQAAGGTVNALPPFYPLHLLEARTELQRLKTFEASERLGLEVRRYALYCELEARPDIAVYGARHPLPHNAPTFNVSQNDDLENRMPDATQFYIERVAFLFHPTNDGKDDLNFVRSNWWELRVQNSVQKSLSARATVAPAPATGTADDFFAGHADQSNPVFTTWTRNEINIEPPFAVELAKPVFLMNRVPWVFRLHRNNFRPSQFFHVHILLDGMAVLGIKPPEAK